MIEYKTKSLDGIVDIEKVKEIRKSLRRRYANRTNIQKIFKHWDDVIFYLIYDPLINYNFFLNLYI